MSCDPLDIPKPVEDDPLFESTFNIDGATHTFQAGTSDYIMNSDFTQDSLGVTTFVSRFEKDSCSQLCFPSLEGPHPG